MSQILREYRYKLVFIGFFLLSVNVFAQDKDIDDVKKHAAELFEAQNYSEAKDLYSQLVSLYPKDENFNYRFGACLLYVDVDKTYPLKFLEYAVSRPNVEVEAFYYLGKGYHYNYRFQDAIEYFNKYLGKLDAKAKNVLPAKQDIWYCQNGLELMKNITYPHVISKRKVNAESFYNSIKLADIGGRVLPAPQELHSSIDKKKGYTPILYKRGDNNIIYFTSYGDNEKNGIDIFTVTINNVGTLGKPIRLPETINTPSDEGFPFLTNDGTSFYFSSKGHNSMGGYDLFRATYDEGTDTYGTPQNLDYSVNTPDDDLMYADMPGEGFAFFASNRNCEKGKVYVYKIESHRSPFEIAVLAGKFDSKNTRSCKITVEDLDNHVKVGSYSTDKKSGEYVMRLRNGGTYSFLVEPYGSDVAYQGRVELPDLSEVKVLRQEIEIVDDNGKEKLIIRNLFQEGAVAGDEQIIAQVLVDQANIDESKEPGSTITSAQMATEVMDAKQDLEHYIGELKTKQTISYNLANDKRELAQRDLAVAEQLESQISLNDNSEENRKNQAELTKLLSDAKKHSNEAEMAFMLGNEIGTEVTQTQKKLNKVEGYLNRIQNAEQLENQVVAAEAYKKFNADEDVKKPTSIQSTIQANKEVEEQKMTSAVKKAEGITQSQVSIKQEISAAKSELKATKKKKLQEPILTQISELEIELAPLESQKEAAYKEANSREERVNELAYQLEIVEEVNSNAVNSTNTENVTTDQKEALIASIQATTGEIEALENSVTDKVKSDTPKGNEIAQEETITDGDSELAASGSDNKVDTEDLIDPENEEELTENEEEGNSTGTNEATVAAAQNEPEYFEYASEYEAPSESVILVEGASVPLDITSNTGKKQYKTEELKGAEIVLSESSYNSQYKEEYESVKNVENTLEKSKQTQSINYNWVVDIEKEVAELSYAKSQSNNSAYNSRIDTKITELNNQASQKRNFMALNARIIKQLKEEEENAVAEGEALVVQEKADDDTEVSNETVSDNLEGDEDNTEMPEIESGASQVIAESETPTPVIGKEGQAEEIVTHESDEELVAEGEGNENETEQEAEQQVNANDEAVIESDSEGIKLEIDKQVTISPTEVVIIEYKAEREKQVAIVETKKSDLSGLQNELEVTKKKKKKQEIQAKLDVLEAEVQYEEQKLRLLAQKKDAVVQSQDIMIADPLTTRPSEEKFVEAKRYRTETANLETQLEELQISLENTRKKKKKRVIQAEIQNVEKDLKISKLNADMTLSTAAQMERIEILTLKEYTSYGVEEMVKIPEVARTLTVNEEAEVAQYPEYQEYIRTKKASEKSIENASVLYQSASEKENNAQDLQMEISLLENGIDLSPVEEQDSLRVLITEKKEQQKRLIAQAQVYYQEAKSMTNDAYYNLNEANSDILVMDRAEERTQIFAMIGGNIEEVKVEIDSNDIDAIPTDLAQDIFINSDSSYYNESKPIPVDVQLPQGVILKVQIGAFRNPINPSTFIGFAPIVGEKTSSGLTRYTAGLFKDFETANLAKNSIRGKGYSDAFVVAYLNGKRISITQARRVLAGETTANSVAQTTNPTTQAPPTTDVSVPVQRVDSKPISVGTENVKVAKAETRGDLYFTVQIGVYSIRINPTSVFTISPLNTENIANNLVRYSSGVYGNVSDAINARNAIVANGISDAFVTAYYNGKRITVSEAKRLAGNSASTGAIPVNTATPTTNANNTEEEGVFYVAVGPYQGSIPVDQARIILGMGGLGVVVEKNNNATLYKIGNFTSRSEAEALKADLEAKGLINPTIVKGE